LLVAPPWDVPAAPGREVIVIDPGMAFGTGQHPTTRTCLEELEEIVATRRVESVLDVGTGTGILAAVAARLGVRRVVAVDIDPATLPIARATLRRTASGVLLAGGSRPCAALRPGAASLLADTSSRTAALAARSPRRPVIASGILGRPRRRVCVRAVAGAAVPPTAVADLAARTRR
jgi:ribosomal protein L11 methyltransferase